MFKIALIQARSTSTRLPNKCFKVIGNQSMTSYIVEAAHQAKNIDFVGIICPEEDYEKFNIAYGNKCFVFGGAKYDLLQRFCDAVTKIESMQSDTRQVNTITRLTSDCPLLLYADGLIDEVVKLHIDRELEYTNNIGPTGYPSGLDVEVIDKKVLFDLNDMIQKEENNKYDREHVTTFIRKNELLYKVGHLVALPKVNKSKKLSVDTLEEFEKVSYIIEFLDMIYGPKFKYMGGEIHCPM